jgi:hypothetical protein
VALFDGLTMRMTFPSGDDPGRLGKKEGAGNLITLFENLVCFYERLKMLFPYR